MSQIRCHAARLLNNGLDPGDVGGVPAQAYAGFGHTPVAVITAGCGANTSGTMQNELQIGVGFATAAAQRSVTMGSVDAQATMQTHSTFSATLAHNIFGGGGGLWSSLAVTSFDGDGLSGTWAGTVGIPMNFLSIGGAGVTNAVILTKALPDTTGSFSITGAGFKGNFAMLIKRSTIGLQPQNCIGFGVCNIRGQQAALAIKDRRGSVTSSATRYQRTDRCLVTLGSDVRDELAFLSFDDDGMTFNSITSTTTEDFYILILKVPDSWITAFTTLSAPGTQTLSDFPFPPQGGMIFSFGGVADTTTEPNVNLSISFFSGPNLSLQNSVCCWGGSEDGVADSDTRQVASQGDALVIADSATGAIHHEVLPVAITNDGLSLPYTTADAAYEAIAVAFGVAPRVVVQGGVLLGGKLGA
jgi:hypothetical protein